MERQTFAHRPAKWEQFNWEIFGFWVTVISITGYVYWNFAHLVAKLWDFSLPLG